MKPLNIASYKAPTDTRALMQLAWSNARIGAKRFGGVASDYFTESLKLARRGVKLTMDKFLSFDVPSLIIEFFMVSAVFCLGFIFGEVMISFGGLFKAGLGASVLILGYLSLDFDSVDTAWNMDSIKVGASYSQFKLRG